MKISEDVLINLISTYSDDSAKTDLILSLINSGKKNTINHKPKTISNKWLEEENNLLEWCALEGMKPAEIFAKNFFPNRSLASIRKRIRLVYVDHPHLKDEEMARRARCQGKTETPERPLTHVDVDGDWYMRKKLENR